MDSPSGKIRQAIGLAKRRLQDALRSYQQIQKEIDLNPAEINNEQLYNTFETAHDVFRRLSRNVQRLDELHKQWQRIIETNPSEKTTFDNYITAHGDFRPLVEEGRTSVDHLRLRIGLLRDATSNRLELTDPNDLYDNGEGTLDIVPSNDAVFSTPTTPTHPSTPATPATQANPPAELSQPSPGWMDLLFLPNVSIPQFNGNPSRWNEFWDQLNALLQSEEERHRRSLTRLDEAENLAAYLRRNLEQEMRRPHKARRQPCPYCNSADHNPLDCTVVVDRSVRRRPQIVMAGNRLGDNLESAGWVYRLLLRIL